MTPLSAVEIIAHRGASYDAPENTVASFRLGWQQQADANELDVYLTKDGQTVVIHDKTTKRTTGTDLAVADATLAELRALDAGSWKGEQWKGEKLPTLAEALATIPDKRRFFLEIKCGPEILPEFERVVRGSGKTPSQLAIIAFNYDVVKQAKERMPEVPVYWLVSPKKDSQGLQPSVDELIAKAKAAGADGLDLDSRFAIDAAFVAKMKEAELQLFVWTVDDAAAARRFTEVGVNGITTNRPAWLREQLGEAATTAPAAAGQ